MYDNPLSGRIANSIVQLMVISGSYRWLLAPDPWKPQEIIADSWQVTERSWRFLVADVAQVAAVVATSPTPPCLYETMLAGVSGLRMFFDIEYCIQMNATRVAAGLDASIVPEIVQQVDLWLARFSQAKCTVDRKASVVLAASDAVKLHCSYM